jgi:hypothetical protein
MKTITLKHLITALSLTMGFSVMLNSMHAADAAAFTGGKSLADYSTVKKVTSDDPNAYKLIGDMHNHVDKHTLKSITKTFSEQNISTDPRLKRHLKSQEESEIDHFTDWLKRMLHSALLLGS